MDAMYNTPELSPYLRESCCHASTTRHYHKSLLGCLSLLSLPLPQSCSCGFLNMPTFVLILKEMGVAGESHHMAGLLNG
jgi:hypothetical protein